jgi:hypothetical protein
MTPHIVIAMPCGARNVDAACVGSLIQLTATLTKAGIPVAYAPMTSGTISVARNRLMMTCVKHLEFSHILWWDSDISPTDPGGLVLRMLEANQDLIVAAYAFRGNAQCLTTFGAQFDEVVRGAVKIDRCGFGFNLLNREAALDMVGHYDDELGRFEHNVFDGSHARTVGVFDEMTIEESGERIRITEDFAFCRRWQAMGRDIWAVLDAELAHVGEDGRRYTANLSQLYEIHQAAKRGDIDLRAVANKVMEGNDWMARGLAWGEVPMPAQPAARVNRKARRALLATGGRT